MSVSGHGLSLDLARIRLEAWSSAAACTARSAAIHRISPGRAGVAVQTTDLIQPVNQAQYEEQWKQPNIYIHCDMLYLKWLQLFNLR